MQVYGIYCIRNIINNQIYIGSAVDINKRWREHKSLLNKNKHYNFHLQYSYNKYTAKNFEKETKLKMSLSQFKRWNKKNGSKHNTARQNSK